MSAVLAPPAAPQRTRIRRPTGVTVLAVAHFGAAVVLAAVLVSSSFSPLTYVCFAALALLAAVVGKGLWDMRAWAWWPVFTNSALELSGEVLVLLQGATYLLYIVPVPMAILLYMWSSPIRSAFAGHEVGKRETPPVTWKGLGLAILTLAALFGVAWSMVQENKVTVTVRVAGDDGIRFEGKILVFQPKDLLNSNSGQVREISGVTPAEFRLKATKGYAVMASVSKVSPGGSLSVTVTCPDSSQTSDTSVGSALAWCSISPGD